MRAAVLAVDGGNSKADVALVDRDGNLLAAVHGPTVSHQAVGLDRGMDRLEELAAGIAREAGIDPATRPLADIGVYSVAGADYPSDIRLLRHALGHRGLAATDEVLNDSFGALRAGTDRGWGIVLICGQGINAAAVAPDGRSSGFPAVGDIAGDWGGAGSIGMEGLRAAIRGRDGRGPRTSLERLVPAHYGLSRPSAVTKAMYDGRLRERRVAELSPVVFAAATDGDAVARSIVDRLAAELVSMGVALIRRLKLTRLDLDVVLGGGVFRTRDEAFFATIERGLRDVAPKSRLVRLHAPPVVGAALIGLDRLNGATVDAATAARVRAAFARWKPERVVPDAAPETEAD
ncbi:MAG: N-acetylglucosamine kinase [Chloroflexota bacterium]